MLRRDAIPVPSGPWVVINKYDSIGNNSVPRLARWDGKHAYWGGGVGHSTMPTGAEIVYTFENKEGLSERKFGDWVEAEFCRKFPLKPDVTYERGINKPINNYYLRSCTGWISPTGDLYACDYGEHDRMGFHLYKQLVGYESMWIALRNMRENGWATYQSGRVSMSGREMNLNFEQFWSFTVLMNQMGTVRGDDRIVEMIEQMEISLEDYGWPELYPANQTDYTLREPTRWRIAE